MSATEESTKVEQESRDFIYRLQEIYCKNELHNQLEHMLGAPTNSDERQAFYEDVDSLVKLYMLKVDELSASNSDNHTTEKALDSAEAIVHALACAINSHGADDDAPEGEDDEIPLEKVKKLYETLAAALTPSNVEAALVVGAMQLAVESQKAAEEAGKQKQSREGAETMDVSPMERKAAMKVSPEELFRMAQHVRSGLADESDLLNLRAEDEDDDAVELNEADPRFLRNLGLSSFRRKLNYRMLLPSQQLREARTPWQRQNVLDRLAQSTQGNLNRLNSMERVAEMQMRITMDRRMIARKEKRRQEQQSSEAPASPTAADETEDIPATAGSKASLVSFSSRDILHTELDEVPGEGGFRPRDLPTKLPPWMRHSFGSKPHFGIPPSTQDLQRQRRSLPIYHKRDDILQYVDTHSVTILVGETGSGKTTQIPQYLAEHGYAKKGIICCTQPRRVAAETLAMRVAEEYGCRLGEEVGYTVRFRDVTSSLTRIKYMTDGMLLREALLDDSFARYSVIILDEAHERSINTDLLFAIVRNALQKHTDLKVMITSATLETKKFCDYFGIDQPFMIEGRTFPVDTYYLAEPTSDYMRTALQTVMKIHLQEPPGDVLVFLTGQEEIETGGEMLFHWMEALRKASDTPIPDMLVLPLTATMPQEVQSRVFEATPPGCRKVVLATNVAETSITINNLYYVVDSGYCKQNLYNPKREVEQLKVVPVSQAQAEQRSGRAGRIGPGKCFRIYTELQFREDMAPETVPDIMRANLFHVTLQLKAMGIDLFSVDLMDPPSQEAIVAALEKLRYLEALDDDGSLTPLGGRMAQLSVDPFQSKTLLTAVDFGCSEPVLTIVSMLAAQKRGIFYRPRDRQEAADAAKRQFWQPEGDQITLMVVYNMWVENGMSEEWCQRNFVKYRMLVEARDTRDQLKDMLTRRYTNISHANDDNLNEVRRAITAGYFFHAAKRVDSHTRSFVTLAERREVYVHPSSVLIDDPPKYVLYDDIRLTNREYMQELLTIEPKWLVELAPAFYTRPPKGRRLTREQEAERFTPLLKSWETGSSWRISRQRKQRR
ncbi:unnamed protein product [Phytomonas sp. EM1]|nr:unnamed protein product [Phytomonas sp. EM1]|eukprot:CCW60143.1 unnamed protein product [Phytomonas sp. isolate EM1]